LLTSLVNRSGTEKIVNSSTAEQSRPQVVFAYDFDGTLAPGYMQDHAFIPDDLGLLRDDFWEEVKAIAKTQRGDEIHAYMHLMLTKAAAKGIELNQASWRRRGESLPLFPGVEDWFERQNMRARDLGLDLRHFIISSGNREMIEGSRIARHFERIYASAFIYDENGNAAGAALAVNYTNKTQYIFRINKGTLEEWDDLSINKAIAPTDRPVPFDQFVYFGDGATDVPTMRLVTDQGGYSVAVYVNSEHSRTAAASLRDEGRARFAGPADYTEAGPLDVLANAILTEISARQRTRDAVRWP
jgi:phosphoserine phosphatase